jgi:anaerobic dimethyl sulfoxide reductase subunit B (iron-sulfur subunit)
MSKIEALLIDYQWCSGCQSCELACRNEHEWNLSSYGIKVLEMGPYDMPDKGGMVEWNYVPATTSLCDLCSCRVDRGELPACELHCLAGAITSGTLATLSARAAELVAQGKHKISLLVP